MQSTDACWQRIGCENLHFSYSKSRILFSKQGNVSCERTLDFKDAFVMLSECHLKADSKHDAASAMVDAANANKKVSVVDAIGNLKQAVIYFNDLGRLSIAAKHVKECGELFEKEGRADEALAAYQEAGDLYAGEENSSTANACKLKVAELSAVVGKYTEGTYYISQLPPTVRPGT